MRANLDAHILSAHRPLAPSSARTSSGTGQSATFQQILQQQPASPPVPARSSTPPNIAAALPVRMATPNPSSRDVVALPAGTGAATPGSGTPGFVEAPSWGNSKSLTQLAPAPPTTTPGEPGAAFSNFGTTPNGPDPAGGQTYNPMANPLLTPQTSSTDINGTLITQNTSPTVTASAAQQFAQVLGGSVVQLQTPWSNLAPVYGIELPDGQLLDATAVANILGNNAAYPSAAVKSGEIAKLMGVQYTPAMANLATQLAGGANANLPPIGAGRGVMSAPLLTPADGSAAPVAPASSGGYMTVA
jgi:hypothetical protein